MNELARDICKREGLKKQTNVAQIKEILRVLAEILADPRKEASLAYLNYVVSKIAKQHGYGNVPNCMYEHLVLRHINEHLRQPRTVAIIKKKKPIAYTTITVVNKKRKAKKK